MKRAKKISHLCQSLPPPGHVRANREKALFSHMCNFARDSGKTSRTNPCAGVRSFKETGRETVVEAEVLKKVMAQAGEPLHFALLLAHLTGQRPRDVLHMSENHIAEVLLHVRQGKTAAKLRIQITGELKELTDAIKVYKSKFATYQMQLLVNEEGCPMTTHTCCALDLMRLVMQRASIRSYFSSAT